AAPTSTARAGELIAYSAVDSVPSEGRPRPQASAMLLSRPPRSPGCQTEYSPNTSGRLEALASSRYTGTSQITPRIASTTWRTTTPGEVRERRTTGVAAVIRRSVPAPAGA